MRANLVMLIFSIASPCWGGSAFAPVPPSVPAEASVQCPPVAPVYGPATPLTMMFDAQNPAGKLTVGFDVPSSGAFDVEFDEQAATISCPFNLTCGAAYLLSNDSANAKRAAQTQCTAQPFFGLYAWLIDDDEVPFFSKEEFTEKIPVPIADFNKAAFNTYVSDLQANVPPTPPPAYDATVNYWNLMDDFNKLYLAKQLCTEGLDEKSYEDGCNANIFSYPGSYTLTTYCCLAQPNAAP